MRPFMFSTLRLYWLFGAMLTFASLPALTEELQFTTNLSYQPCGA